MGDTIIMKYIKILLKGIVIGFASVGIPGLSASTVAIILGIYYLMIEAISSIFKTFKKSITFLLSLLIGYGIGALLGANLFSFLYDKYPFVVTLAILGFVFGTFPKTIKDIKPYAKKTSNWLISVLLWIILLVFSFVVINTNEVVLSINMPIINWILLGIIGFITAGTLVVPGLDYVVVLLSLGYYSAIMGLLNIFAAENIINNLLMLGVYLVCYGIGAFLLSKSIKKFLDKNTEKALFANLAFITISPVIIIKQTLTNQNISFENIQINEIIIGIIFFIMAFLLVLLFYHLTDPNDKRPRGMKKRNMFRFFFTIASQFPQALYYYIKMRKIIKEDKLTLEEKYTFCMGIAKRINRGGNVCVHYFGKEYVQKDNDEGILFVANHQGRYDGIAVYTALQDFPFSLLADKDRINFPIYREIFLMTNGIIVDYHDLRKQIMLMKEMGDRLSQGNSFLAFIEGKYGDNKNTLQEFKTGVLRPAYQSKCKIIPVVLYDTYKVYSISSLKKVYPEVHFLEPIYYEEYKNYDKKELSEIIKTKMQNKIDEINKTKEGTKHDLHAL